jgi:isopentenyl-diphosphate delta-isomerase
MQTAITRRLAEELGMRCRFSFLFKFEYHAQYGDAGAEHELCWVYAGVSHDRPQRNPSEIAELRWVEPDTLDAEMAAHPDQYTPWFQMEWARIRRERAQAS